MPGARLILDYVPNHVAPDHRTIGQDAAAIREHLRADLNYESRLVRFLENHGEPRIASRLPTDAERAAAVAIATLPGAHTGNTRRGWNRFHRRSPGRGTGFPVPRSGQGPVRSGRDRSGPCDARRLPGSRGCRKRTAPTARPRPRR
jgi:hypothetical protein